MCSPTRIPIVVIFGYEFPSTWYQSVNAVTIVLVRSVLLLVVGLAGKAKRQPVDAGQIRHRSLAARAFVHRHGLGRV